MKQDKYIFKLRRDMATKYDITVIYPHFKNLKKKYSTENGKRFFRESLEGKVQLFGENFDLVYRADINTKFTFIVELVNDDGSTSVYFKGYFSKIDCKFDVDHRMCEPKISSSDQYSSVLDGYENRYDLFEIPPAITPVYMYKRPCIQVYISGGFTLSNFVGGTSFEQSVPEAIDVDKDLVNKYYFAKYGHITEVRITGVSDVIDGNYAKINTDYSTPIEKIYNGKRTAYMSFKALAGGSGRYYIYDASSNKALAVSDKVVESYYGGSAYVMASGITNSSPFFLGDIVNFTLLSDGPTFKPKFTQARGIYQRLLCDVDKIAEDESEVSTYDLPVNDIVTNSSNYHKVISLKSSNSIMATTRTVSYPTRYGINDDGEYFTNAFIPQTAGAMSPLPLCKSSWNNTSIWYVYSPAYTLLDKSARKRYVLKDAFKLSDVIKALLSKVAPNITHEATTEYSDFLYGSFNPVTNDQFTLFITPKTNVLKSEYDQAARKSSISLKDVMDMLEQCFRCYWYIEDNKLKIEHVSWFNKGRSYVSGSQIIQYDLTALTDPHNLKHLGFRQSSIEYDKSELASRYEFEWMDTVTDAFNGTSIDVVSDYVDKSLKNEISIKSFTSDIDYMLLSPSDFSNDGFALMAAKSINGNYELPFISLKLRSSESHLSYTLNLQNGYLSWFYLVRFYMLDMPSDKIKYNELESLNVVGTKSFINQDVKFYISDTTPDPYKLVKTDLGAGYISNMTIDLMSKLVDATIMYNVNNS